MGGGPGDRLGHPEGSRDHVSEEQLARTAQDLSEDEQPERPCSRCGGELLLHWHGPLMTGICMKLCPDGLGWFGCPPPSHRDPPEKRPLNHYRDQVPDGPRVGNPGKYLNGQLLWGQFAVQEHRVVGQGVGRCHARFDPVRAPAPDPLVLCRVIRGEALSVDPLLQDLSGDLEEEVVNVDACGLQRAEDLTEIPGIDQGHGDQDRAAVLLDQPHRQVGDLPPPQPKILEVAGRHFHGLSQRVVDEAGTRTHTYAHNPTGRACTATSSSPWTASPLTPARRPQPTRPRVSRSGPAALRRLPATGPSPWPRRRA